MTKQYVLGLFIVFFITWAFVVDNLVLPSFGQMKSDAGVYTRYRVKQWNKPGKSGPLEDELLIYAVVKNRENLYYIDKRLGFEERLKGLEEGTAIQLGYVSRFPKPWKRKLYDLRVGGSSLIGYGPQQLKEKQKEIWKFTGIMGGAYFVVLFVGLIKKPRRQK
jgi:hypothetical protein